MGNRIPRLVVHADEMEVLRKYCARFEQDPSNRDGVEMRDVEFGSPSSAERDEDNVAASDESVQNAAAPSNKRDHPTTAPSSESDKQNIATSTETDEQNAVASNERLEENIPSNESDEESSTASPRPASIANGIAEGGDALDENEDERITSSGHLHSPVEGLRRTLLLPSIELVVWIISQRLGSDTRETGRLPSTSREGAHLTPLQWATYPVKALGRFLMQIHKTHNVFLIMASYVIASLAFEAVILCVPLNPVDDGPEANKWFTYAVVPIFLSLLVLTFIATANSALPEIQFSVPDNVLTTLLCALIGAVFYYSLAFGSFSEHPVFPVPFSVLSVGFVSTLAVSPVLYGWTTKQSRDGKRFWLLFFFLGSLWVSLAVAVFWATGITRTESNPTVQFFLSLLNPVLRFVCKMLVVAPITYRLNQRRMFHLNHIVDLIFTAVSSGTFPFIANWWTMSLLFSCDTGASLWQIYCCVDRINLLCVQMQHHHVLQSEESSKQDPNAWTRLSAVGKTIVDCFSSPAPLIHQMSKDISQATLSTIKTCDDEDYQCSFDEEEGQFIQLQGVARFAQNHGNCESLADFNHGYTSGLTASNRQVQDIFRPRTEDNACQQENATAPLDLESQDSNAEEFDQRLLYHNLDCLVKLMLSLCLKATIYSGTAIVWYLPTKNHMNSSFSIDDDKWKQSMQWGGITILLQCIVCVVAVKLCQHNLQRFEMAGFNIRGVILYSVKRNYLLYLMWTLTSLMYFLCCMIGHFGFDFTFDYKYLGCLGNTAWPACPP